MTAPGTTSGQPVNHTPTQTHTLQHAPPAGLHPATVKQRHPRCPAHRRRSRIRADSGPRSRNRAAFLENHCSGFGTNSTPNHLLIVGGQTPTLRNPSRAQAQPVWDMPSVLGQWCVCKLVWLFGRMPLWWLQLYR